MTPEMEHESQTVNGCNSAQKDCRSSVQRWWLLLSSIFATAIIALFGFGNWNASVNARQDTQISINTAKLLIIDSKLDTLSEKMLRILALDDRLDNVSMKMDRVILLDQKLDTLIKEIGSKTDKMNPKD